jgi:hypothetical protein
MNDRRGKQNNGAPRLEKTARGASSRPVPPQPAYGGARPAAGGGIHGAGAGTGGRAAGAGPGNMRAADPRSRAQSGSAVPRGAKPAEPRVDLPRGSKNHSQAARQSADMRRTPAGRGAVPRDRGEGTPRSKNGVSKGVQGGRSPRNDGAARRKKGQPGKLRAQTAAQRRRDINERRGITPEQAAFLRRRSEIKRYYIKKRRISAITLFFARFTALVIVYLVLFVVTSGLFVFSLNAAGPSPGEDVTYQLGEKKGDDGYKVETLKYRDRVRDGQLYLNFTEVAEYLGFVTTGDMSELRYLTKYSGGEEVLFAVGTSSVTVNGSMTRMPVPAYYEGGTLYVPLDFIKTYIKGISVGINEENGRLVLYRLYTLNSKGEKIYEDITFTLKPQVPSEHIDENSLPVDIKLATEPKNVKPPESGSVDGLTG